MMQSVEEHQVPKEDAVVKSVKGRKKRSRGRKSTAGRRGEPKELTEKIVDPGGSWLPPAGRCLAMQQWHGEKGNSAEKVAHRKIVDGARN
jgi:hypothetical protein